MPFFIGGLHWLDKVAVVLLWGMAINTDIIIDGNDTWEVVSDSVHAHLEDILAHLQAEGNVQEPVPSFVGVEGYQV